MKNSRLLSLSLALLLLVAGFVVAEDDKSDSKTDITFSATDAFGTDGNYNLNAVSHGKFKMNVKFSQTPHFYGTGKFLWGGFGSDTLTIDDSWQTLLEANEQTHADRASIYPLVDTTGEDAIQQGLINQMYSQANDVDFEVSRNLFAGDVEFNVGENMLAWLAGSYETREGARVIGAGAYERWNEGSGLGHVTDRIFTEMAEVAEPIDYQTTTFDIGFGLYKTDYLVDAEYSMTNFVNNNSYLHWDNPFRITDKATGGKNRSSFVVGQLALVPDHDSFDTTLNASVALGDAGRFSGSASYGIVNQNQDFVSYTMNSDINNTPAGKDTATPASLGVVGSVTDPASLPQSSLNGKVSNASGVAQFAYRASNALSFVANYRFYSYVNDSHKIHFPGYAGYGETAFRARKNDKAAKFGGFHNEIIGYTRNTADMKLTYRVNKKLTLNGVADWKAWSLESAKVDNTNEIGIGGGFKYRPSRRTSLKASYKYSDKTTGEYLAARTAENPEATGLFNFNWAERTRQKADIRFATALNDNVTINAYGKWLSESYGGNPEHSSNVADFRFARNGVSMLVGGVDLTVIMNDNTSFYATYVYENRLEEITNASKDDSQKGEVSSLGVADQYPTFNYWNTDITEVTNTLNAGISTAMMDNKLDIDFGYGMSFSNMELDNYNPNPVIAYTLLVALAYDWKDVVSSMNEVYCDFGYQYTEKMRIGFRYSYEMYNLDDEMLDIMTPYMANKTLENTTRAVFTDSSYTEYNAHVGGLYMVYKF